MALDFFYTPKVRIQTPYEKLELKLLEKKIHIGEQYPVFDLVYRV